MNCHKEDRQRFSTEQKNDGALDLLNETVGV